jgi:lysozyme
MGWLSRLFYGNPPPNATVTTGGGHDIPLAPPATTFGRSLPSNQCIALIERSEGCVTTAMADVDGVYVLGYGCKTFDGQPVVKGQTCTPADADRNCRVWAQKCATAVLSTIDPPLTQGQLDALTDFVYNVGLGALQQSTILRTIKANQTVTEAMFTVWDKIRVNGQLVEHPGLLARRKAEYQLFIS